MRCEDVRERLSAFQDDELDGVTSREIEHHLEGCSECAGFLAEMKELSDRVRAEAPYHRAPDSLRDDLSRAAWSNARRGRAIGRRVDMVARGWLGAAAAVLVILGGAWVVTSARQQASYASMEGEVVSSHIRSLMASHMTDVASTDQHTVKPWFNGKLDFSPPVSDFSASGYPLIGGRLDYLQGRPVAALVYQRRKHWINVFTWPDERATDSERSSRAQNGYHVIHEIRGGTNYWVVSDLNADELSSFARMLVASGEQKR